MKMDSCMSHTVEKIRLEYTHDRATTSHNTNKAFAKTLISIDYMYVISLNVVSLVCVKFLFNMTEG